MVEEIEYLIRTKEESIHTSDTIIAEVAEKFSYCGRILWLFLNSINGGEWLFITKFSNVNCLGISIEIDTEGEIGKFILKIAILKAVCHWYNRVFSLCKSLPECYFSPNFELKIFIFQQFFIISLEGRIALVQLEYTEEAGVPYLLVWVFFTPIKPTYISCI
jgi:hypothetical protein